ncbi:hypothetical protein UlMin_019957 [Ulmus minor]
MEFQFPSFPLLLAFLIFMLILLKISTHGKKSRSKSSTLNLPPGPLKLPVIGNLHNLVCSLPHQRLRDLSNKNGPLMFLQLGEVPHVVVSSPEIAQEIFRVHDINFCERPFILSARMNYLIDIAFAAYGDYWRQLRKICKEELLSSKRVESFRSIREEEVSNLIGDIVSITRKGEVPINLSEKIFSMTYGITARASFGKKCSEQEAFISSVKEGLKIAGGFNLSDMFPSQRWLNWLSPVGWELEKNFRVTDKIFENIISEFKADKATRDPARMAEEKCLLDVLFDLQENGGLAVPLEKKNIKAVLSDVFAAGSETSSVTVEWAMLEMLKNPKVMENAQAEVRQLFGKMGNVDETSLYKLKYLKLIIKETLRLHPPAPLLLPRQARESCVINGFHIPAKTNVLVNAWAIGRDPRYWSDAESFKPERFLESSIDFKGTNFEFIPFGAGRRMCPGITFAMADIELPLAQLLFQFDWKLPEGINHENLNMTERFGLSVRRKEDLYIIPVPYNSSRSG